MLTTFYPPYHTGGCGIHVYQLSNLLAQQGHQVEVIHCLDSYFTKREVKQRGRYEKHTNLKVHRIESGVGRIAPALTYLTGYPLLVGKKIKRILEKDFDVIHYHNISLFGGLVALGFGDAVKLFTLHTYWLICPTHYLWKFNREICQHKECLKCTVFYGKVPPQFWRYSNLLDKMLKNVNALIAPSAFLRDKHLEGGIKTPIEWISNFVLPPGENNMPEDRPQYGLPFEQLPARDITPESFINEQTRIGRQQIDNKYKLMWNEINRSARFTGRQKASNMQRQLIAKGKQEMLQFNQRAQQQLAQLRNIDQLTQQGMINNPDEIKARMTFGADVAKSMYPTPEKEKPPMQQFADLDTYSHRISDELEWFKEDKPSKFPGYAKLLGPTGAGVLIKHYVETTRAKRTVRIMYPDTEDYTIKATPEQIAEYDMWRQEGRDVAARKKELTGQLGVGRRRVQPGTKGGTFGDKIAESVRPRQAPTAAKPKVIRK